MPIQEALELIALKRPEEPEDEDEWEHVSDPDLQRRLANPDKITKSTLPSGEAVDEYHYYAPEDDDERVELLPGALTIEGTYHSEDDDPGDSPETLWRRGLMNRAREAAGDALYEDWSQYEVDDEVVAAAEKAARAWVEVTVYLRKLQEGKAS